MIGRINTVWLAFLASVVALLALIAALAWPAGPRPVLLLYCAAGIKAPVEAAARDFERASGVQIQLQFGGSNTLLASAQITGKGDLYLPGDDSYIALAWNKGLIGQVIPLARMRPVLAVRKGNPKRILSIQDLLRDDVRVSQANPDATAIGGLARDVLRKTGHWEALHKRLTVEKATVNDVANDVKVGAVDAAFVWDATVHQIPDLEAVQIPAFAGTSATVSVALLRSSAHPDLALRLARHLAAPDKGLVHFKRCGFQPPE